MNIELILASIIGIAFTAFIVADEYVRVKYGYLLGIHDPRIMVVPVLLRWFTAMISKFAGGDL